MARVAKSLVAPEQGFPHRDHRSKKGRVKGYRNKRQHRIRLQKKKEVVPEIEIP